MASNYASGEVHALLLRILSSLDYSFNRLSKENKDNHLQILDRFDKQVHQKSSIQTDNTDIDDQECPVGKSGEDIRLGIDNQVRIYHESHPSYPLTLPSVINEANMTNQDEPPLTLETKNQEEQRGIHHSVTESTSGDNDYSTGKSFPSELENRIQQYHEDNPDSSLPRRSMYQGKIIQDGSPLPLGTKKQEDQRGISRPVRQKIPASKQSPTSLANAEEIKEFEERLLEYDDRYTELDNTHNALTLRFDELFRVNSAKDGRISELAKQLDAVEKSNTNRGRFLAMKEDENMQNEKLIQTLQKEKSDLQEKLSQDRFSQSEEDSQKLVRDLLQEKNSFATQIESYEGKNSHLRATMDRLQIDLGYSRTEFNKAIESRDSYHARCQSLTNELSDLGNNRQTMKRAIQEKESLVKRLQQDNSELKTSLETYQEQSKFLQNDTAQNEVKLESFRAQNAELITELDTKTKELSKLHHELERDGNLHRTPQYIAAYTPGGYSPSPYHPPGPSSSGPVSSTFPSAAPPGYYNDPYH